MFTFVFTFCAIAIVAVVALGIWENATNNSSDYSVFGGF
jgi:1,4-dihydroxy-2-naphthoate octaprenyltransferase